MKKHKLKRINLFVIFLLIFVIFFSKGFFRYSRNLIKLYSLKKQKRELLLENQRLREDIKRINTPEYIEYVARVNYGLKKNFEIEYRFPPPEKK